MKKSFYAEISGGALGSIIYSFDSKSSRDKFCERDYTRPIKSSELSESDKRRIMSYADFEADRKQQQAALDEKEEAFYRNK